MEQDAEIFLPFGERFGRIAYGAIEHVCDAVGDVGEFLFLRAQH
jgi:hypothetical protein